MKLCLQKTPALTEETILVQQWSIFHRLLKHKSRMSAYISIGYCETMISLTCVVAQALSLLSPPVEPDAEAH